MTESPSDSPGTSERGSATVVVVCGECGELVEVKDPAALVRALHLMNACELRGLLAGSD